MKYQNIVLLALSVSGIILLSVVIVANRSRQTYRSQASESSITPFPTRVPTNAPTNAPTKVPTNKPTNQPTPPQGGQCTSVSDGSTCLVPGSECYKSIGQTQNLERGKCIIISVDYATTKDQDNPNFVCACELSEPTPIPTAPPLPCENIGGYCINQNDLPYPGGCPGYENSIGYGILYGECRTGYVCCPSLGSGGVENPSLNEAGLTFKIRLPNVAPTVTSVPVNVSAYHGSNKTPDDTDTVTLVRDGDYFKTPDSPDKISLQIDKDAGYSIYVKGTTTLARLFTGVSLTRGRTTSCVSDSDAEACGELVSARDIKYLYGGDSDGFTEGSDSYNKIDTVDLAQLAIYYDGIAPQGDFNADGSVDTVDLSILAQNYERFGDERIYEQK